MRHCLWAGLILLSTAAIFVSLAFMKDAPPLVTEPGHEVTLMASTPEGVRVYRVTGPKAVVPVWVAVDPRGGVAIR